MRNELKDVANQVSYLISAKFGIDHTYYDGSQLLNKGTEETILYICTINRTAGKTTFYLLFSMEIMRCLNKKTVFLVRKINELKDFGRIFEDVSLLYYDGSPVITKTVVKDTIVSLHFGDKEIGYVICLKKYVDVKRFSPIFADVEVIILDEYQPDDGIFVKKEVDAFQSIYRSVARGRGKQIRNISLLLYGNPVTLMNPYLLEFGISHRYKKGIDYIIDKLWVAEFKINEAASNMMKEHESSSLFSAKVNYDCGEDFLIDDSLYMEKCSGKTTYIATISYGSKMFGMRLYEKNNIIHIGIKHDPSCKKILAFRENDRQQNYELIEKYDFTWNFIRKSYKEGKLRFDNLDGKRIIFSLIGVDMYGDL